MPKIYRKTKKPDGRPIDSGGAIAFRNDDSPQAKLMREHLERVKKSEQPLDKPKDSV